MKNEYIYTSIINLKIMIKQVLISSFLLIISFLYTKCYGDYSSLIFIIFHSSLKSTQET